MQTMTTAAQRIGFLSLFIFLSTSCASGPRLKDTCAATNWEDRARGYADQGKNLPDSEELRACADKVDPKYAQDSERGFAEGKAHYCSPESARLRGLHSKSVTDMGIEFCGADFTESFTRYQSEGQITFCSASNGRTHALAGQPYEIGHCPPKLEPRFLKAYNKGRREYLREKVDKNNEYLQQLDAELLVLQKQNTDLGNNKPVLDFTSSENRPQAINVQGKTPDGYPLLNVNNGRVDLQNKNSSNETVDSRNRREAFANQDSDISNKMQRMIGQQNQIRTQNREYEAELQKLNKLKD